MGNIPRRTLAALLLLTVLAGICRGAEDFKVDLRVGWDNCHRPGQWCPLEVMISTTRNQPFSGELVLSAQQDSVTQMEVRHAVVVARQQPIRVPLVSKLSYLATECRLSLVDEKGRTAWADSFPLMDFRQGAVQLTAAREHDVLIGTSGSRSRVLAQLDTYLHSSTGNRSGRDGIVLVRDRLPAALPWDWTGYECLDVLVLCGVDWSQLRPQQVQAIADYVHGGGNLLLAPGQYPWPVEGPLAALIPFRASALRQDKLGETNLPGGRMVLHPVSAWPLTPPAASAWQVTNLGTLAAFAHGPAGFGQVGVLAFNPAEVDGLDKRAEAGLWQLALERLLGAGRFAQGPSPQAQPSYYEPFTSAGQDCTNAVLEHLLTIPQLRPLNVWFVIGLLVLLAVMLGPVDYFLLKKLDRLPWTWVTSACVIAGFTAAAYYGVKFYRAGDLQVRAVSVVDCVQGQAAWSTVYAGIFAPDSDDYRLDGLGGGQWWAAISPLREEHAYMQPSQLGGRAVYCRQGDGANLPVSLPISIYSMQCLLGESNKTPAPLSVKPDRSGDSLAIEVTNHMDHPASRILVWHGRSSWEFPAVAGGATTRLTLSREPDEPRLSARLSALQSSAVRAQSVARRTAAIARYQDSGSILVIAEYDQAPLGHTVQSGRCGRDHVLIARVVVPMAGGAKRE